MDRHAHDERRQRDLAPAICRDAVLADDGLWLGGEALVAPMYVATPRVAEPAGDDYADPAWQVI